MDIILWIAYCLGEGIANARIFAYGTAHFIATNQKEKINIHAYFWVLRVIVWCVFLYNIFINTGSPDPTFDNLMIIGGRGLSLAFIFTFFHEGAMNLARKLMEPDQMQYTLADAWFYLSKTSTSRFNFVFWVRMAFLLIGGTIYYFTI